ncbi:MAG: acyl-CoA thioesterase [Deltaproteobacteria bacterium]|jgi:acyl-CoA thioester hydrolase|nr:acyl-CoA thioesterase [Deltaproteobacteria bacterium]
MTDETDFIIEDGHFKAVTRYRVLYADTDLMGVVNNAHYFRFFEQGRGEYLRLLDFPYVKIEEKGIRTPLTEAWAHYYLPFRYDDLIRVECWLSQVKNASFRFDYQLYLEGSPKLHVTGRTLHATVNLEGKVVKIPDWLTEILNTRLERAKALSES